MRIEWEKGSTSSYSKCVGENGSGVIDKTVMTYASVKEVSRRQQASIRSERAIQTSKFGKTPSKKNEKKLSGESDALKAYA